MNTFRKTVIIGKQAGKVTFLGSLTAAELLNLLHNQVVSVNPDAQRSIAKSGEKETTIELLEDDRIESTPRMKSIVNFYRRVMDNVEFRNTNHEGFFGCLQLAIPEHFTSASLSLANTDPEDKLSNRLFDAMNSLGHSQIGVLNLTTKLGETAVYIGDGQGRAFGFHSFRRVLQKKIVDTRQIIRKKEKKKEHISEEEQQLKSLEKMLERINNFLSETDVPFVCYADSFNSEGQVKGLPTEAERRLYIEGNALNSLASKEEVLKYETFSPVVMQLQEERVKNLWMSTDYIEEDSKSISSSSTKLFTLSALVQAFSLSIVGHTKPSQVDEDMFDKVSKRYEFVSAFWQKVSHLFEYLWIPPADQMPNGRLSYLQELRGDKHRNVVFQAIFLIALGKLGYKLGEIANWNLEPEIIKRMGRLSPDLLEYSAVKAYKQEPNGKVIVTEWRQDWQNSMMKASTTKDGILNYTFNNTHDSIDSTYRLLLKQLALPASSSSTKKVVEAV